MTKNVDWEKYVSSKDPIKGEIERDLIKKGVLSINEACHWTVFSRKDNMLFSPATQSGTGLFFTTDEYASEYVKEKYGRSHKEVTIYRFCNNKFSWQCIFCHLKQAVKIFVRSLAKR